MKKIALALVAFLGPLLSLGAASGTPVAIFADTFDDLSQWTGPSNNDEGAGRVIETTSEGSEAIFGEAGNSYLRIFKAYSETNANNTLSANAAFSDPSPVVTLSFVFWNSAVGNGNIVIRPGGASSSNANRIHEISFARGNMSGVGGLYQADQTHRVEIVLNNSTETVYYADHYSVASDTFDVWIDGVLVLNNHTRGRGFLPVGEPLASLQFATFTSNWGELLVDDLVVYKGAQVTPATENPLPAFSDDFDDLSAWTTPTNQLEGHREIKAKTEGSELYFGAPGSYLSFYKNDPEGAATSMFITAADVVNSPVATVSFDFWQDTTADLLTGFAFRAGQGTSVPNASRVHNLTLRNGAINDKAGLYAPDQLNNIQIVYNNSSVPVAYLGGARELESDAMDIWINGNLVLRDERFFRGDLALDAVIRSFQFVGFTNDRTEVFIDNFQVYQMPVVFGTISDPGLPAVTITDFAHAGDSLSLSFTTEIGFRYVVEYSEDLAESGWQLLETIEGTGDVVTSWDRNVSGRNSRFYRVSAMAAN